MHILPPPDYGMIDVLNFTVTEGPFWRNWLEVFKRYTTAGAAEIHTEIRFAAQK